MEVQDDIGYLSMEAVDHHDDDSQSQGRNCVYFL